MLVTTLLHFSLANNFIFQKKKAVNKIRKLQCQERASGKKCDAVIDSKCTVTNSSHGFLQAAMDDCQQLG